MITELESQNTSLVRLTAVGLNVLSGPSLCPMALAAIAELARLQEDVWVVDGGNRFDALWLAEYLASHGLAPEPILSRIYVSRAFTCHQMTERLLSLPHDAHPIVVLDILSTFYDENIPFQEARRLLNRLWPTLHRHGQTAPLLLTLAPPASERVANRQCFYDTFRRLADCALQMPEPPAASQQPALWGNVAIQERRDRIGSHNRISYPAGAGGRATVA